MLSRSDWFGLALAAGAVSVSFLLGGRFWGIVFGIVAVIALIVWHRWRDQEPKPSWADIERRFKELLDGEFARARSGDRGNGPLTAIQGHSLNPDDEWGITGGSKAQRHEAESFCILAGRALKVHGRDASARLSRIKNDRDRWLWYLVEIGEAPLDERMASSHRDPVTHEQVEQYSYWIRSLSESSVRGAKRCAAESVVTTP